MDTMNLHSVTASELEMLFEIKYGAASPIGWAPAMRRRFGHFNPDDHYEALINRLVREDTTWLDVGCGHDLFPSNRPLATLLSQRCKKLVGVDPDPTLEDNPFVHEKHMCTMEEFVSARRFDLVTMRMVAEHVAYPATFANALARCVVPGAQVVIYTVNGYSPMPLLTRLMPFRLRHPIKRVLWGSEEKDTFPTCFRMNSRRRLAEILGAEGFREVLFDYLDDCRTFGRFRPLLFTELSVQRACRVLGLRYPENCLLGVYERFVSHGS